jgi:GTP cyclohydrolase IA
MDCGSIDVAELPKCDGELGERVKNHLIEMGVETPMKRQLLSPEQMVHGIQEKFGEIMDLLGLDRSDDSLEGTPNRVAKMFVNELFYGLDYANFPKATTVQNKLNYDNMVTVKDISTCSACEHHFVVIDNKVTVSYIPGQDVLGLSKINRIVDFFAKRPQIQERMTQQIFHAMSYILGTQNVAVIVHGVHYCVKARGVRDVMSSTITSKLGGVYESVPETRMELFKQLDMKF